MAYKNKEDANANWKKWAKENPEKVMAIQRRYREKHPEKCLEASRRAEKNMTPERRERRKAKKKISQAKWYEANRERLVKEMRIHYKEHPEQYLRSRLKSYGITEEQVAMLREEQAGLCAICGRALLPGKGTNIDHDHANGMVRGLLCRECNLGLGHFFDKPALLYAAGDYLKRFAKKKEVA
jgi:hypothetical protein